MFRHRYYQAEARAAVRDAHDRHRSTALVMPTGTGKTEIYLSLAVEEAGRVLVLVHRDYLITSPVGRLRKVGFDDVAVEKAEQRSEREAERAQVVFASVQSLSRPDRLADFDPLEFSLLVIDEGHRTPAVTYRRVKDHFEQGNPKLKTLICTATPKRKDGVGLWTVCDSVAYEMTPAQAAEEGWIVPPRFFVRDVPQLDFSRIDLKGSDLDADQVAELLMREEPLHKVCASLVEDRGPTIVFCPKVDVAQAYAAAVSKRYRPGRAVAIHEGSTGAETEAATRGLADGSIDYVFNVDKLTEGYDVPRVVRVAWASPTASLVRWTQGCGRGFRPDPSVAGLLAGGREDAAARRLLIEQSPKPYCSIVTYHPSNCQHQICTAVDLLGGDDLPADLRDAAEQIQEQTARQGGGSATDEDLETARVFCDLKAALEERRKRIKAKATVADQEYDGMGGKARKLKDQAAPSQEKLGMAAASWGDGRKPVSPGMADWLTRRGAPAWLMGEMSAWQAHVVRVLVQDHGVAMATALGYGRRQALKVRDEMAARKQEGATP